MKNFVSSAGLVYVYFNGCEKDGFFRMQHVDTYSCMEEAFYHQIMDNVIAAAEDGEMIHVFAVLGIEEKASMVYRLTTDGLIENVQRIFAGKSIQTSSNDLDSTGNAFFRCVQEFFLEKSEHHPVRICLDCGDFMFAGICSGHLTQEFREEVVSFWMEREKPRLCGRQVILRSFLCVILLGGRSLAVFRK